MKKSGIIFSVILLFLTGCGEEISYPDTPEINFSDFYLYITENELGSQTLTGNLVFSFTDGDGNVGLGEVEDSTTLLLPDTLIYDLFLQTYSKNNGVFEAVSEDDGGLSKYRLPYIDKSPLNGTITVELEYPLIVFDTVFYTFFIYDRDHNRSNIDSTYVIIFTGISTDGDSVHFNGSE